MVKVIHGRTRPKIAGVETPEPKMQEIFTPLLHLLKKHGYREAPTFCDIPNNSSAFEFKKNSLRIKVTNETNELLVTVGPSTYVETYDVRDIAESLGTVLGVHDAPVRLVHWILKNEGDVEGLFQSQGKTFSALKLLKSKRLLMETLSARAPHPEQDRCSDAGRIYISLIEKFLQGEMIAVDFENAFLSSVRESPRMCNYHAAIVSWFFIELDLFCSEPEIRVPESLDEQQLLQRAQLGSEYFAKKECF